MSIEHPRRPTRTLVRGLVLPALALVLLASCTTVSASQDESEQRSIVVSATGRSTVTPDLVKTTLQVSAAAATVEEASEQAASSAASVRKALLGAGVSAEDVSTQALNVGPVYDYNRSSQEIVEYRATQVFVVSITDASTAGAVIDAAVAAGGNDVSVLSTETVVSPDADVHGSARVNATEVAREKAETYAEALGFELGKVISVSEVQSGPGVFYGRADAVAAETGTVVDLGSSEASVTIEVRWEIR